jgi:hypothetical protein
MTVIETNDGDAGKICVVSARKKLEIDNERPYSKWSHDEMPNQSADDFFLVRTLSMLRTYRPIRPNPLIPMLIVMMLLLFCFLYSAWMLLFGCANANETLANNIGDVEEDDGLSSFSYVLFLMS